MRNIPWIFLISIFCIAGCTGESTSPPPGISSTIRKVGGAQFRKDAESVAALAAAQKSPNPSGVKGIPESLWTDSIRKLNPKSVYYGTDSLTIVTAKSDRYANGINIYFPGRERDKGTSSGQFLGGGSGYGEYSIEDGITWYWSKKRFRAPQSASSTTP